VSQPVVFLGLPHRDDFSVGTLYGVMRAGTKARVIVRDCSSSILTYCFNQLWAMALNARLEAGLTHFAMMHSDVGPQDGWMDIMLDELEMSGADLISAVIPLKDARGLTSTAFRHPDTGAFRRLTMTEAVHVTSPFDAAGAGMAGHTLLVNTGLWVMRLDRPWVEELYFRQGDGIMRAEDGRFAPVSMPEDWMFSLDVHRLGGKVVATRSVGVDHKGDTIFSNDVAWGTWVHDKETGDRAVGVDDLRPRTLVG
jgi:hypothetical protein